MQYNLREALLDLGLIGEGDYTPLLDLSKIHDCVSCGQCDERNDIKMTSNKQSNINTSV